MHQLYYGYMDAHSIYSRYLSGRLKAIHHTTGACGRDAGVMDPHDGYREVDAVSHDGHRLSGLLCKEDFISIEHETSLIRLFRSVLQWPMRGESLASRTLDDAGSLGPTRLSLHYGHHFDYRTMGVDAESFVPFPDWLIPLLPHSDTGPPDQVCLQYYPPGAGIPPHCDTHSIFVRLCALSLGAPVSMEFRRPPAGGSGTATSNGIVAPETADAHDAWHKLEIDLLPRAMIEMTADARYRWQHGIKKRKSDHSSEANDGRRPRQDRWSITYRWLRRPFPPRCECGDATLCDTAQADAGIERAFRWKEKETEKTLS